MHQATRLFVQKGYGAVSMNEVCTASGVSKGSLYHHFPSKDELLLQIVEEDTKQWLRDWGDKQRGQADLEERFYLLAEHCANDFQNPLIQTLEEYARSKTHPEAIVQRLSDLYNASLQACRDLLKEGLDTGYLKEGSIEDYLIIFSGLMEGIAKVSELMLHRATSEHISRYYREAMRLLLAGARTE
ncbi:TetR/AcrR family transcriptional regulator [Paenibacillus albidus]|nr:TetR/AcrR family transcriptional regulator [Paenibacillus albidus]